MAQIGIEFDRGPRRPASLGVRELVERAHRTVERAFGPVWVEGEIANLKLAGSGHAYFTLREGDAALSCAMWRSSVQRLRFRLAAGKQVRVHGKLGIYAAQGKFQMYVDRAEPAGLGDLMARYERLKQKLAAEGLFDAERKRPLPASPRTIGVVTSASGAAIHDICKVIAHRRPSHILLSAARVQGAEAPTELRAALARLQAVPEVDVIIIGRGGGSLEDLWAFNDEALARAVRACPVPVISAVGHEVDVSLCDLVADVRAATPSQAGELVVPDAAALERRLASQARALALIVERRVLDVRRRFEHLSRRLEQGGARTHGRLRERLLASRSRLEQATGHAVEARREALHELTRRLLAHSPQRRIERDRRRLDGHAQRLAQLMRQRNAEARLRLAKSASKLDAMSPLRVLDRGYALATRGEVGAREVIVDAEQLDVGDALDLRFARGRASVRVDQVHGEDEGV